MEILKREKEGRAAAEKPAPGWNFGVNEMLHLPRLLLLHGQVQAGLEACRGPLCPFIDWSTPEDWNVWPASEDRSGAPTLRATALVGTTPECS